MSWLLRQGEVLASIEITSSLYERLIGFRPESLFAATMLRPAVLIQSISCRSSLDIAFCDHNLVVVSIIFLKKNRICLTKPKTAFVLEAPGGSFERWNLQKGDCLEIKG